jgi:DNA-binding transcriptional ArsR family regulator
MPANSSQIDAREQAEIAAIFGGRVEAAPQVSDADLAAATLVGRVRGEILAAVNEDGVGVRELARRLDVSPAAVSRHLRSEGDLRLSTAALFAAALGRKWNCHLVRDTVTQSRVTLETHTPTTTATIKASGKNTDPANVAFVVFNPGVPGSRR